MELPLLYICPTPRTRKRPPNAFKPIDMDEVKEGLEYNIVNIPDLPMPTPRTRKRPPNAFKPLEEILPDLRRIVKI